MLYGERRARRHIPQSSLPDVAGILLLEKCADLLQLVATSTDIIEEVTQLRGIGLDLLDGLLELGIAFEDEDLVFGTAFLAGRVDWMDEGGHVG